MPQNLKFTMSTIPNRKAVTIADKQENRNCNKEKKAIAKSQQWRKCWNWEMSALNNITEFCLYIHSEFIQKEI